MMIVGSLSNRLRVFDWLGQHPEVREERIDAPIVVIGMFRAGTTLLSRLFDQDPRNRALLMWEAGDSVPPPSPANHRQGPRVDAVHANNAMLAEVNPQIEVVHHEQADEATECITVMAQDFKSLTYEAVGRRDYTMIMATTLMFSVLTMLSNLIADVLYATLDPRIRLA